MHPHFFISVNAILITIARINRISEAFLLLMGLTSVRKDGIVFKPKWNFEAYRLEVDSMIKHHWETSYPSAKYGGNGQIPWDSCLNWKDLEGFSILERKNAFDIPIGDSIWLPMPTVNPLCPNLETELLIVPAYHSIYVNLYRFKDTTIAYPGILAGNGVWVVKNKRWIQVSGSIMSYEGALIPRTEESTISPHDTTDTPQSYYRAPLKILDFA